MHVGLDHNEFADGNVPRQKPAIVELDLSCLEQAEVGLDATEVFIACGSAAALAVAPTLPGVDFALLRAKYAHFIRQNLVPLSRAVSTAHSRKTSSVAS
jgi:hypothetical protein